MASNSVRAYKASAPPIILKSYSAPTELLGLQVANGTKPDRRFAWDKKLTPADYA